MDRRTIRWDRRFAVHVSVPIGFTVARYAEPEDATAASASPAR